MADIKAEESEPASHIDHAIGKNAIYFCKRIKNDRIYSSKLWKDENFVRSPEIFQLTQSSRTIFPLVLLHKFLKITRFLNFQLFSRDPNEWSARWRTHR